MKTIHLLLFGFSSFDCLLPVASQSHYVDEACASDQRHVQAPHKNVWLGLTEDETRDVINLLHDESTGLNLTRVDVAGSWDNVVTQVELLQPNKTDVLPFLSGDSPAPDRHARATLTFRATDDIYAEDYIIGPLPVTDETKVAPLTYVYNKGTGKVKLPIADLALVENFNTAVGKDISDITKKLFNTTFDEGLISIDFDPPWHEGDRIVHWSTVIYKPRFRFASEWIRPAGLYFRSDVTGRDPASWKVTGWYYDGVFYSDVSELRQAMEKPEFRTFPPAEEGEWAGTDQQGEPAEFDSLPPPMPIERGPKRFSVDEGERYVSWMDFSFYLSWGHNTGLRLHDVHYKGERIIYELALQEVLAHYAGNDPMQSGSVFYDGRPGLGPFTVSLIDGFDCPTYSTYLNVTNQKDETSSVRSNSICLFEFDEGYPIQRHSTPSYTSITKNIAFYTRFVATLGNYDYTFDYKFSLDGSIEVSVRASGYILGAFSANNEEYGFKIHDNLSGSMHDHVLTYKLDLDVLGESNSLQKVEFTPATVEYPWSNGVARNTMKAERSFIDNESEGKINMSPNCAAMYSVVNKDKPNKYGEYPGYHISAAAGELMHFTVENSTNILNAANFATHHLYVTKQKDTEPQASNRYINAEPADPLVDFAKFFDDESLDQEDVVLWFNLGMHHLPDTSDLPNTVTTTAHSSLVIKPQNYLKGDASKSTSQQVRIDWKNGTAANVQTFGAKYQTCAVNTNFLEPDLWRFGGEVDISN